MTPENASKIAVSGLQFIAGDESQLSRFIALTGIDPAEMRQMADSSVFMVAILDFFMGDEPTLLSFAASCGLDPVDIPKARMALEPAAYDAET